MLNCHGQILGQEPSISDCGRCSTIRTVAERGFYEAAKPRV